MSLAFAGCVQAPEQMGLRVTGFVNDADTQERLSAAEVFLQSDTLDIGSGLTDSDGRFTIDVITDAEHAQLRAEKEGYVSAETTVFFDAPIRRVDIDLRPSL